MPVEGHLGYLGPVDDGVDPDRSDAAPAEQFVSGGQNSLPSRDAGRNIRHSTASVARTDRPLCLQACSNRGDYSIEVAIYDIVAITSTTSSFEEAAPCCFERCIDWESRAILPTGRGSFLFWGRLLLGPCATRRTSPMRNDSGYSSGYGHGGS